MIKYSLEDILAIKNSYGDTDLSHLIDDDVKRYIFIIDYKFKEKKGHRSKYNNPKPISFCDIRLSLNKLSIKTFDIQFKYIISTLHLLSNEEKSSIFQDMLNHLSKNSFMLEPYSKLAIILIDVFDDFKDIFFKTTNELLLDFTKFDFPVTTSHDDLCIQNKYKDEIKAQTIFFISTMMDLGEFQKIEIMLNTLQQHIEQNVLHQEQQTSLEFICNIYKNVAIVCIKKISEFTNLIHLHVESILKKKDNKNINRKIIFHHMDVSDVLKKNT